MQPPRLHRLPVFCIAAGREPASAQQAVIVKNATARTTG
jgi:hypothetical protein